MSQKKIKSRLLGCFILIIVLGSLLRFLGIGFGYPDNWHPDEWRIVSETLSMANEKTLISPNVNYPSVFKYILLCVYGLWYLVGYLSGLLHSPTDFATLFFLQPGVFLIVPRILNSILGILTIIFGYFVGKEYFGRKAGLIASLFIALEHQLLVHSQVGLHQTIASLSVLPVFFFIHRVIYKPNTKNFVILGVSLGSAASIHQTAILLLPPILMTLFIVFKKLEIKVALNKFILMMLSGVLFSIVGNLNWVFKYGESIAFLELGSGVSKIAFSSQQVFDYTLPSFFIWLGNELIGQDLILGLLAIFGVLFALIRRKSEDFVVLTFLFTYGLFFNNWAYRWLHLLISLIPILMVYAAHVFSLTIKRVKPTPFMITFLVILISPNLLSAVWVNSERWKVDTRTLAKNWVEREVSSGSSVAIDWSAYNLSLNSPIPIHLLNPIGELYFLKYAPLETRLRLNERDHNYNIIQAMHNIQNPIWPKDMSDEDIKLASKQEVYRNLYSYFNFVPLESLKVQADYLVITSYSYSMFLTDSDPNKINPFNIYLKDDIMKFQSHTDKPSSDKRHGLLFYLAKRGRDFYNPLLNGTSSEFKEVVRFEPARNYSGPTVIIFRSEKV